MKRPFALLTLALCATCLMPTVAYAFSLTPEGQAAEAQMRVASAQSAASVQIAWIYGAAIVLAGIAVGLGVYFAARSSRRSRSGVE